MTGSRVTFVALAAVALGCAPIPATQVKLELFVEPALAVVGAVVDIELVTPEGDSTVLATGRAVEPVDGRFATLPIVPRDGDSTRRPTVRVTLAGPSGVVRSEIRFGFTRDELRVLRVELESACLDVSCEPGQTCSRGVCVGSCYAPELTEETGAMGQPTCGTCEHCRSNSCQPVANGAACGCPGDSCVAGSCVVTRAATFVAVGSALEEVGGISSAHTCAAFLRAGASDGASSVYCWGSNELLQTAAVAPDTVGTPYDSLAPGSTGLAGLVAGSTASCVLAGEGSSERVCWGASQFFGDGDVVGAREPTRVADLEFTSLSMGSHACGLSGGQIYCWGYNEHRAAVPGATLDDAIGTPTAVMPERSDFLQVDAEGLHTCAIGRGEIWCWGLNTSGELGIGEDGRVFTGLVTVPQQAARSVDTAGAPWTSVSNGAYHTCALLDDPSATRPQDDRLFCWGGNFSSQVLGIDTSPDFDTPPTEISSEHGFRLVEAGGSRTCAIRVVSHDPLVERLECWGSTAGVFVSGHGLGVGVPEPPAGTRWDTIDVAHAHTCGIRDDRSLWCWGSNEVGQLGSLSTELTSSAVPIRVCPP